MASDEKYDESRSDSEDEDPIPRNGFESVMFGLPRLFLQQMNEIAVMRRPMVMMNSFHGPASRTAPVVDQALCEFPPPDDLSHHFTEADLNREIEQKYLSFVANACDDDTNYRRLARKVEVDQGLLRRLDADYGDHVREHVYQLLLSWKKCHPEAKVRDLVTLLTVSKLPESAVQLSKYISSIDWRD